MNDELSVKSGQMVTLGGYYGNHIKLLINGRYALISYLPPKLVQIAAPTLSIVEGEVEATAQITDIGIGDITRCGFYAYNAPQWGDGGTIYNANFIPSETGQEIKATLEDLPSGTSYITAFAENGAGRALTDFIPYRNSDGWQGGMINGINPDLIARVVIGKRAIEKKKIKNIYIGKIGL